MIIKGFFIVKVPKVLKTDIFLKIILIVIRFHLNKLLLYLYLFIAFYSNVNTAENNVINYNFFSKIIMNCTLVKR